MTGVVVVAAGGFYRGSQSLEFKAARNLWLRRKMGDEGNGGGCVCVGE